MNEAAQEAVRPPDAADPLAGVVDREFQPLDPRSVQWLRRRGRIRAAIVGVLLLVAAGVAAAVFDAPYIVLFPAWLAPTGTLVWLGHFWPPISYRHAAYRVRPDGIEIRRGVLVRRMIHVSRSRIQHTDVSQGPIERSLGLGTVTVHTAGTSFARVQLYGLAYERALDIRQFLIQGASGEDV